MPSLYFQTGHCGNYEEPVPSLYYETGNEESPQVNEDLSYEVGFNDDLPEFCSL